MGSQTSRELDPVYKIEPMRPPLNIDELNQRRALFEGWQCEQLRDLARLNSLRVSGPRHGVVERLVYALHGRKIADSFDYLRRKHHRCPSEEKVRALVAKTGFTGTPGWCALAAIQRGFLQCLGDPEELDKPAVTFGEPMQLECAFCMGRLPRPTLRQLLTQPDHPDWEGCCDSTVHCKTCKEGNFFTLLCQADFYSDPGKYTHHCRLCPGLGGCVHDNRSRHCLNCGEHFFAGTGFHIPCTCGYSEVYNSSYYAYEHARQEHPGRTSLVDTRDPSEAGGQTSGAFKIKYDVSPNVNNQPSRKEMLESFPREYVDMQFKREHVKYFRVFKESTWRGLAKSIVKMRKDLGLSEGLSEGYGRDSDSQREKPP